MPSPLRVRPGFCLAPPFLVLHGGRLGRLLGEQKRASLPSTWAWFGVQLGARKWLQFDLNFTLRPEIRRDYPLNLSILLSGGKETNKDSLSIGE